MADDTELLPPEEEEVQGGAVKSFLEHLEDLRWTIVKVSAAIFVAMCVCLFGCKYVVAILKWPLDRAALISVNTNQFVSVKFGGIKVGTYEVTNNQIGSLYLGTNKDVMLEIAPMPVNMLTPAERPSGTTMYSGPNGAQVLCVSVLPGKPEDRKGVELVFLDPSAPFLSSMHVAFFGGLFLASPFVLYYLGQFLMPALKVKEKKHVMRAFGLGLGLFITGVCVAYFGVMPRALKFAEVWGNWMGVTVPQWRAETYFSFVIKFSLGMGLGFELPVVLLALVKIGILDYAKLKAMRRYMVVINLVLGALLTTPEVFTQVVMGVVLQILFEFSVLVAWYWEREKKKRGEE